MLLPLSLFLFLYRRWSSVPHLRSRASTLFLFIPPRQQGRAPASRMSNLYLDENNVGHQSLLYQLARALLAVRPLPAASSHDLVKDTRRSLSRLRS